MMPNVCICGEAGVACWLVLDHWRPRKTGPRFPLAVVRCVVHEVVFTLYPHGHVPYGQIAVAPVGPVGSVVVTEAEWTISAARKGNYAIGCGVERRVVTRLCA